MEKEIRLSRIGRNSPDIKRIRQLYRSSFPLRERIPFLLLTKRADEGKADFWGLFENEEIQGFAYVIRGDGLAYLYFLAVFPAARGKGCGSAALRALKETYAGENLFLALEQLDPHAKNREERLRRHAFYQRCGLEDLPIRIKEMTMVYAAMGIGRPALPAEFDKLMRGFLGGFFSKLIRTEILPEQENR